MNENFKVLLEAMIDKSSLNNAQKQLAKERLKMNVDITIDDFAKNKDALEKQFVALGKTINGILGNSLDDKTATAWGKQFYNQAVSYAQKSVKEIDKVTSQTNKIQLSIDTEKYSTEIFKLKQQLSNFGAESGVAFTNATQSLNQLETAYNNMKSSTGDKRLEYEKEYQKQLATTKNLLSQITSVRDNTLISTGDEKRVNLINKLNKYLESNSKMNRKNKQTIQEWINTLASADDMTLGSIKNITNGLAKLDTKLRQTGQLGLSWRDKLSQAWEKFGGWSFATGTLMKGVSEVRQAYVELKNIDSILTEISKTADQLSKKDIINLGEGSYDKASKYGKKASDYLLGVQEMYRAGYSNAENLAELSTLAQSAGDMNAELANDYIIATDAAYKLKGNTEALNDVLDGQNYITNRNALSMKDLAEATKIAASQSASSGITVNEMTAALGTMIATTRQGGDIAARALKGILMNVQQVKGEVEDGEIIDADQLSKYEKASEALGVSLKEVKNGIVSLRDPMQILKELSEAYTSLDESDSRRANLINAVGGKYRGNQLNALLENWSLYEKMLKDYSEGSGSALEEAMKSANNWEGSLNRLSNAWIEFVDKLTNQDAIIGAINVLSGLINGITAITDKIGVFSALGGIGGIALGAKNAGLSIQAYTKNNLTMF